MIWLILLIVFIVIVATYSDAVAEWYQEQEFGKFLVIIGNMALTAIKEYFHPITWFKGKIAEVQRAVQPPSCRECKYCKPYEFTKGVISHDTSLDKCNSPEMMVLYCSHARSLGCGRRAKYFKRK